MIEITNLPVRHGNVPLRVARGHFATNHSHINYYIDITYQKTRFSEAKEVAKQLVANFINNTPVDTILCLDSQMIFRDNIQTMIRNKHVLILMASCTTGYTANKGVEAVGYYGGEVVGVAALYSSIGELGGLPVRSVYKLEDLPDYASYDYKDCPYCKKGRKLDALVNSHGYSAL